MKKKKIKIELHTSLEFANYQNVVNTAMALAQSGWFINIIKSDNGWYLLEVYRIIYPPLNPK
jgi:hypothetical protein